MDQKIDSESTCVCGQGVRGLIQMFEQFNLCGLTTPKRLRDRDEKGALVSNCPQCKKPKIPAVRARTLTLLVNGRPVARSVKHLPIDGT